MTDWNKDFDALFEAERHAAGPSRQARARVRAGVMKRVARGAGAAAAGTAAATAVRSAGASVAGASAPAATGVAVAAGAAATKGTVAFVLLKLAAPILIVGAVGGAATGLLARSQTANLARTGELASRSAPSAVSASPLRSAASAPSSSSPVPASPVAAVPAPPPRGVAGSALVAARPRPSKSPLATRAATLSSSERVSAEPAQGSDLTAARASSETFSAELALVNRIEGALPGDPKVALSLSEAYTGSYPQGALREEASGARVMALCALGRTDAASSGRDEFLRAYPQSLLQARIDRACSAARVSITAAPTGGQ